MKQPRSPSPPLTSVQQPDARARRLWRALLVVLMLVVCWLAFTPNPPPQADTGWDKMNHLLAFSVLGLCAGLGWAGSTWRMPLVAIGMIAFGIFIELVQARIPGRSGEWPDLLADALGIGAGLLAVLLIEAVRGRLAQPRTST